MNNISRLVSGLRMALMMNSVVKQEIQLYSLFSDLQLEATLSNMYPKYPVLDFDPKNPKESINQTLWERIFGCQCTRGV